MLNKLMQEEYLKNEKVQIIIRLVFISIATVSIYFYYFHTDDKNIETHTLLQLIAAPIFVFILNLAYLLVIKYFPYAFQEKRIVFSIIIDIVLTTYVMFLVDALAAYYTGALLWFSIGYGMRYGKKIAYTAYITTIVVWIALLMNSSFWLEHIEFGIGWLLTFIILPLYYFRLVSKLRQNIKMLNLYAQQYEYSAFHDQLTGLSNRMLFNKDLREHINHCNLKGEKFALFFIDLDSFKDINDLYGHDIGDKVLIEASNRLKNIIDNTYRLGGDEFVCMFKYQSEYELICKAKDLMLNLTTPCPDTKIILSGSIGIARFPSDAKTEFEIKKRADLAMYNAKNSGKNRYYFYEEVA